MKMLIWNTRGLGDEDKNNIIFKQIMQSNANLICIQETKLQDITIFKARQFLPPRYTGFVFQPADGAAGGILFAWSEREYDVSVIQKNKHSLTVQVNSLSDDTNFVVTNVYAPCDATERGFFFQDMKMLQPMISGPWVLAGDFNIYRYTHEKNNSNISWLEMEAFNQWIDDLELMDIDICNSRFTWSNKRRDPTLVRLDRVLVNLQWERKFLNSECKTLGRPTSDHKPLMLDNAVSAAKPNVFR
jgi:exonuclease III